MQEKLICYRFKNNVMANLWWIFSCISCPEGIGTNVKYQGSHFVCKQKIGLVKQNSLREIGIKKKRPFKCKTAIIIKLWRKYTTTNQNLHQFTSNKLTTNDSLNCNKITFTFRWITEIFIVSKEISVNHELTSSIYTATHFVCVFI